MQTPSVPPPAAIVGTVGLLQDGTPIAVTPVQHVAVDWSVLIPLIFAGVALLITTSVSAVNSLRAKRGIGETRATIEQNAVAGAAAGAAREAKLDHISILVNGRYSQVLQELAAVRRLLAVATGSTADHARADAAQQQADQQAALVTAAAGDPPTPPRPLSDIEQKMRHEPIPVIEETRPL